MRVLIADDEPRIGILIRTLIDWERLDLELEGIYQDGQTAFEMICEKKPDIVITDIRMPLLSGLDLIRKTKEAGLTQIHFIVVSGYRYFEYAHSALKYGVEDYLLKPIDEEELNKVLIKICQAKEQSDQKEMRLEKAEQKYEKSRYFAGRDALSSIFSGKNVSLPVLNEKYGLALEPGLYQLLMIVVDETVFDDQNDTRDRMIAERITQCLNHIFAKDCKELLIGQSDSETVFCLLNYSEGNQDIIRMDQRQLISDLKAEINTFQYRNVTAAVSINGKEIDKVPEFYIQVQRVITRRFWNGTGTLYRADGTENSQKMEFPNDWPEQSAEIRRAAEICDSMKLKNTLNEVFRSLPKTYGWRINVLVAAIIDIFTELFGQNCDVFSKEQSDEIQRKCRHTNTIFQIQTLLTDELSRVLDMVQKASQERERRPVQNAIAYIKEHYSERITLDTVAKENAFNPTYFSEMFKQETGKNFSDYLLSVRIEEAKKMLRNGNMKIYEIAEAVGYKDTKYFSQIFEKTVGMKPNAYRKLYE